MEGNTQSNEKTATTKLIAVFFPLKPLRNKFSSNFIGMQIADFLSKLNDLTEKALVYKIDKERFYTFDLKTEKFDDTFDIIDNETVVTIFSVDKTKQIDVSSLFEADFLKNVNTIRIHRKRVDSAAKPSYVFYTINSTKLLNSVIPIIQNDKSTKDDSGGKTYFILSANNAKRDISALDRAFTTEKICRMNYISTIETNSLENETFAKSFRKKIISQITI